MINSRARAVAIFVFSLYVASLINSPAFAAIIQYQTSPGDNVDGEPVNALATFTTSSDTISIKLQNLQADPSSPKSIIYDVLFTLSTGENAGTITSTTGIERTVHGDATFSDSGAVDVVDWGLFTSAGQLHLDRLGAPGQKKHGVIGPPNSGTGEYTAAGGAIAGNDPHNPFWAESAEFVLNVPGVTAATTVTAATFSFNTTPGSDVPGIHAPEPATLILAVLGLASICIRRWRGRNSRCAT
jgi:hypothetical protein